MAENKGLHRKSPVPSSLRLLDEKKRMYLYRVNVSSERKADLVVLQCSTSGCHEIQWLILFFVFIFIFSGERKSTNNDGMKKKENIRRKIKLPI